MEINTTRITLLAEQARSIVTKKRKGLIDRVLGIWRPKRKSGRIISCELIYYPYWIVGVAFTIKTTGFAPQIKYNYSAIDGFTGDVNSVQGCPSTEKADVERSQIVKTKISKPGIGEIVEKKIMNKLALKYKREPQIKEKFMFKIYKPFYIFCCEQDGKKYYRAVDAETGHRNYSLDMAYKTIKEQCEFGG